MLQRELNAFLRRVNHPLSWLAFILGVVFFSSASWGIDGIFYAIVLSGGTIALAPVIGRLGWNAGKSLLMGGPSRLDHLLAPGGYRRARYVESQAVQVQKSIVRPTPNMPIVSEERQTEALPVPVVEAAPAPSPEFHSAPTEYMPRFTPQVRAKQQQYQKSSPKLELASNLCPPLNMVIGRAVLCVGMRGSGKTNVGALLLEQIGQFPIPMAVFDYEGDYVSLPTTLTRCVIGGPPQWCDAWQYKDHYWQVTRENAFQIGYAILQQGAQLVLQTAAYETLEEAALIMVDIIEGMFAWANEQDPKRRVPALILLDEAQYFVPEQSRDSSIGKEEAEKLMRAFMKLNAMGRKRGLTPAVFTQRIAQIKKAVIGGTEIAILMKQTLDVDLARYEEIAGKENVNRKEIQGFQKGDALVFEGGEAFRVHFNTRQSEHRGITPGYEQAVERYANTALQRSVVVVEADGASQSKPAMLASFSQQEKLGNPTHPEGDAWQGISYSPAYSQENDKRPVYGGVNATINKPIEQPGVPSSDVFINNQVSGPSRAQETERAPVNDDIRKHIRRMVEMKKFAHRDIAKVVGLYGPKYHLYRQVCAEEGIEIEKEEKEGQS